MPKVSRVQDLKKSLNFINLMHAACNRDLIFLVLRAISTVFHFFGSCTSNSVQYHFLTKAVPHNVLAPTVHAATSLVSSNN